MIAMNGWVLLETENKKKAGLLELPESAKNETLSGTIVALPESDTYIDAGARCNVPDLAVGDLVAYRKYYSSEIEVDFKKFVGVRWENIIAKLN